MPPAAPRRETAAALLLGRGHDLDFLSSPLMREPLGARALSRGRDPDAFYWRTGRGEPVRSIELDCGNWRHAREPEDFPFIVRGKDNASIRGLITGRLSAANLATPIEVRLPVRVVFEDRDMASTAEEMVREFERVSPVWRRGQRLPPVVAVDDAS